MKKEKVMTFCMLFSFLALCGCKENDSNDSAKADVELETPEYTVEASDLESTQRDYGDKQVQDGFWIEKIEDKTGTWYRYIPMMTQKIPGIYDLEDSEENKDQESYGIYNRPTGTEYLSKNNSTFSTEFCTIPLLGFNHVEEEASAVQCNPEIDFDECFSFIENDNQYGLETYDVGCVTFALYNDLYEDMPTIHAQVYGISEDLWNSMMGEEKDWDFTSYRNLLNCCKDQDYTNCDLLSEKEIATSGIYYIDYNKLSELGDYKQYLIVYRFSRSTSCAYCINGNLFIVYWIKPCIRNGKNNIWTSLLQGNRQRIRKLQCTEKRGIY